MNNELNQESGSQPLEPAGVQPEEKIRANSIVWTRQNDGTYKRKGELPADTSTVRIYSLDEDYATNPHAVCPGLRLWPKEEAIALVEQKIADGSYKAWRYEIRPEMPGTADVGGATNEPMVPTKARCLPLGLSISDGANALKTGLYPRLFHSSRPAERHGAASMHSLVPRQNHT